MRNEKAILELRGLSVYFGGLKANHDLSFTVREGEILGLIGPNGAGKSTCFNTICGVYRPTTGIIRFGTKDIQGLPAHEVARSGIGRTFQLTSLFEGLTVIESITTALHLQRKGSLWNTLIGLPGYRKEQEKLRQQALAVLDKVNLTEVAEQKSTLLNFAAQRRLEIAIAIASAPRMLLLDEPAAGMNEAESYELIALIRRLRQGGMTVLLIEHNMRFVMALCEHIYVMNYGEKFAEGAPDEIGAHQGVRDIYLGTEVIRA